MRLKPFQSSSFPPETWQMLKIVRRGERAPNLKPHLAIFSKEVIYCQKKKKERKKEKGGKKKGWEKKRKFHQYANNVTRALQI
jgi:hypothetical protein